MVICEKVFHTSVNGIFFRPFISKSSSPLPNPLMTVSRAPLITVIFMFHNFFNSRARSRYLTFFSLSFSFTLWSVGTAKSTILAVFFFFFFFLLIIIRSGHLAEIRLLYNCGGNFFILSFFVLYILPFGLGKLRIFRLVHGFVSAWVS